MNEKPTIYAEDLPQLISNEEFLELRNKNVLAAKTAEGALRLIELMSVDEPTIGKQIFDAMKSYEEEE